MYMSHCVDGGASEWYTFEGTVLSVFVTERRTIDGLK